MTDIPTQIGRNSDMHIGQFDFDDDIIKATCQDGEPRVKTTVYPKPMVVLGRGSDPEIELYVDNCIEDNVQVVRRRGGGCAVVIDPGNVVVSMVLPMKRLGGVTMYFNWMSILVMVGLTEIGVPNLRRKGISDIVLENRKVAGSCVWCSKGFLYYTATLLVQPQVELMERYLRYPPKEPDYRLGRSHRDFVGRLDTVPIPKTPKQVARDLRKVIRVQDLKNLLEQTR
jgi:lipoate-protein ligase A